MQADGNLVLFNSINQPKWSTNTKLSNPKLAFFFYGTLMIQNASTFVWLGNTNYNFTNLCLSSDGNPYLYACDGQEWYVKNYLDGFSTIMNKNNGLYLTDTASGILTTAGDETMSQDWKISGKQIVNRATNKILK